MTVLTLQGTLCWTGWWWNCCALWWSLSWKHPGVAHEPGLRNQKAKSLTNPSPYHSVSTSRNALSKLKALFFCQKGVGGGESHKCNDNAWALSPMGWEKKWRGTTRVKNKERMPWYLSRWLNAIKKHKAFYCRALGGADNNVILGTEWASVRQSRSF